MSKSAAVALALTAGIAGAIAGYLAFASPWSASKVTGDSSAARAVWTEVKWPFPIDQWGTGRAFACKAADCGAELKLYLRAKLGACNCTTGVADDDDLDRMSDFNLVGGEVLPLRRRPADHDRFHHYRGRTDPHCNADAEPKRRLTATTSQP